MQKKSSSGSNYLLHQKRLASVNDIKEVLAPSSFSCPICNQGFVSLKSDSKNLESWSLAISQGLTIYPKDGLNYDRLQRHSVVLKIAFSDRTINLQDILEELVQGIFIYI